MYCRIGTAVRPGATLAPVLLSNLLTQENQLKVLNLLGLSPLNCYKAQGLFELKSEDSLGRSQTENAAKKGAVGAVIIKLRQRTA